VSLKHIGGKFVQTTQYGRDESSRLEKVAHNRSGLWVGSGLVLVALLIFVLIFNLAFANIGDTMSGIPLIVLGLVMSIVPAALWLYFFYRMDRLDPEPKHMVISVFVLGALVAAALHAPLTEGMFGVNRWLYNTWWAQLFGGILVVGFLEQFIIYATVYYSVYYHPEFDERVDGVIYAVAVGLGLATVLNFQYVLRHGGVDLGIGSIRMVVNALAYASFAGILGYFMGQARFEKTPFYYMPMGLTIAAVANGLFFFLLNRTLQGGLTFNPWNNLVFAAFVAGITLVILFWLIARANEETLRVARQRERSGNLVAAGATGSEGAQPVVYSNPASSPQEGA
jgi:protease PrsW